MKSTRNDYDQVFYLAVIHNCNTTVHNPQDHPLPFKFTTPLPPPLPLLTYATANNECASTLKLKSYNSLDNSASALCCNYSLVVVAVVAIAMPLKRLLT